MPVLPMPPVPPAPVPTPVATSTPCTLVDLGTLALHASVSHAGDWSRSCQYFTFNITSRVTSHVIIDLTGEGLDTELSLHRGVSPASIRSLVIHNDDTREVRGSLDSRFGLRLSIGFYVVEARLKIPGDARDTRDLTLAIQSQQLIPHDGVHQADRTVAYTQAPIANTLGPGIEGRKTEAIISASISGALTEWNRAASGFWPGIPFCPDPCARNTDGSVTSIEVTSDNPCMNIACESISIGMNPSTGHLHTASSTVYIEYPPVVNDSSVRYKWTLSPAHHRVVVSGYELWYLPATMKHELGHTLGLDDLILFARYDGYLMKRPGTLMAIPALDLEYWKQVYREYLD